MTRSIRKWIVLLTIIATACAREPQGSTDPQSTSSIKYTVDNSSKTIDIHNVTYDVVGPGIPGRPAQEMLVLRKTTATTRVVDEVGGEANTTVEAWPLGTDVKEKPLYVFTTSGETPINLHGEVVVVSRGIEDVDWWSVYRIGTGQHLFDTYAPVATASISREIRTMRYTGLEVPPDDATDARLKAANVIAILTYASGERVLREVLITNDDAKAAQIMRSYFDATRVVEFDGKSICITIRENSPSTAKPVIIEVPVINDNLDLTKSRVPEGMRLADWKR